ncbi:MAG: hypothetical protein KAU62_13985 [Candidatus Heimdallarchaeota archaeon]|nr:hypothetical protein [Candidatus Heimdallarchaeota archaeon]MCK4612261.1 hypothetical protein [Candidatus Heimdallarchaeota archaeon]
MNNKEDFTDNEKFNLGVLVGYLLAAILAPKIGPFYIGETRIHHYVLSLGALLFEDPFIQGMLLAAGGEDLPDLIDGLFTDSDLMHKLSDIIREIQEKKKKWS